MATNNPRIDYSNKEEQEDIIVSLEDQFVGDGGCGAVGFVGSQNGTMDEASILANKMGIS